MKKYILIALFISCFNSCAQKKVTFYSFDDKIIPVINIPSKSDAYMVSAANEFKSKFKLLTNTDLEISYDNNPNEIENIVVLRVNPTQSNPFCIYKNKQNITIQATTFQNLKFGVNQFFEEFTNLTYQDISNNKIANTQNSIQLIETFSKCYAADFSYREPYFEPNFNANFSNWYKTNNLEIEWGLWGHNLPKLLKNHSLPETAFAEINGERDEDQYCFTSDELFDLVNQEINSIHDNDYGLHKFMILPNDNAKVCTCNTCKAAGNSKNDASPAVFTFLNLLAKKNKDLEFFTTAYYSIKSVPKFKAEKNIGVYYSTIEYKTGVPISNSKNFKKFEYEVNRWKNFTDNLYIWDYTVNFDNYFDIYPNLSTTQNNLQLFKRIGAKGVFLHGSEYHYSTFQDLKATILAKLMWDVTTDVNKEIDAYFKNNYASKLAPKLAEYYKHINNVFYTSKKELTIYGGIRESAAKYLDHKLFFSFYKDFEAFTETNKYNKEFLKTATALTFLKLELMRDYGFGEFGYADFNKNQEIIVKDEVGKLLDKLEAFARSSKINSYNEINSSLRDYINSWREIIYRYHKRKNYFYKKPMTILSNLDEDYTNYKILNDGAFGLTNYNTNWLICSIDNLSIKIKKEDIIGSNKVIFSFLQDLKHSIYFPDAIKITDANNTLITSLTLLDDESALLKKEIIVALPNKYDDVDLPDEFIITIYRNKKTGKNALACDEVIFN